MKNMDEYLQGNEVLVEVDNENLDYCGRINWTEEGSPEFVFPCTFVKWRFKGTGAAVVVSSKRYYFDVFAGFIIDEGTPNETQGCVKLPDEGTTRVDICKNLEEGEHEICFFKRQDACNTLTIEGIILSAGSTLLKCFDNTTLKMEVYGDSVSAGEVSEALDCVAGPDPEGHEGKYSNSWYSYSWIAARKLNARLHDIAQGGIALLPKTGWFSAPDFIGLEQTYDKIKYYPDIDHATKWDFTKFSPDVCILAFGQNDANPENYMADDYDGEKAKNWRKHYKAFICTLREKYPKALIICTTTILMHNENWDKAIDEVVKDLSNTDKKVKHFLYSKNGVGTPGHIRIPEAEVMGEELAKFVRTNL